VAATELSLSFGVIYQQDRGLQARKRFAISRVRAAKRFWKRLKVRGNPGIFFPRVASIKQRIWVLCESEFRHSVEVKVMVQFFRSIINFLFGCWHQDTSRPFTVRGETYVVCLECGQEFPYSLEKMTMQHAHGAIKHAPLEPALQPAAHYSGPRMKTRAA